MFALERQRAILEKLAADGAVFVPRLGAEFSVTEETIRRDLEKLEGEKKLRRTHGGAVPYISATPDLPLEARKELNIGVKKALAKRAAAMVQSGDCIFLDASTTAFCLADRIKNTPNITVITNSLRIINLLSNRENLHLVALGGALSKNMSFIGACGEKFIDNYFADKMFFSAHALLQGALLESSEEECAVKRRMLANSREHILLCDESKINRSGSIRLCGAEDVDFLFTNAQLDAALTRLLEEKGVKIIR